MIKNSMRVLVGIAFALVSLTACERMPKTESMKALGKEYLELRYLTEDQLKAYSYLSQESKTVFPLKQYLLTSGVDMGNSLKETWPDLYNGMLERTEINYVRDYEVDDGTVFIYTIESPNLDSMMQVKVIADPLLSTVYSSDISNDSLLFYTNYLISSSANDLINNENIIYKTQIEKLKIVSESDSIKVVLLN